MYRFTYFLCLFSFILASGQQRNIQEYPWNAHLKTDGEAIPYEALREGDVFWSKKIWRIIDTREKINLPFRHPNYSLIEVIHTAAANGEIEAYATWASDEFSVALSHQEISEIGNTTTEIWVTDAKTYEEELVTVENPFTWDKVVKYRIMEEWFFNEETGKMHVRILGIAPVMESYDQNGNYRGDETMYWIYYPHLRNVLAKQACYNPRNDAISLSWADIFDARLFSSYIYKESNVYDRQIQEYLTGVDALYESDNIEQNLLEKEHDMWSY